MLSKFASWLPSAQNISLNKEQLGNIALLTVAAGTWAVAAGLCYNLFKKTTFTLSNEKKAAIDAERDLQAYEKSKSEYELYKQYFAERRPANTIEIFDGSKKLKRKKDCETQAELIQLVFDKLRSIQQAHFGMLPPEPDEILNASKEAIQKHAIKHDDGGYPDILKEVLDVATKYHIDTDAIRFKVLNDEEGFRAHFDSEKQYYTIKIDQASWSERTEFQRAGTLWHEMGHILHGDSWLANRTQYTFPMTRRLSHYEEYAADLEFLLHPKVPNKKDIIYGVCKKWGRYNTVAIDVKKMDQAAIETAYQKKNHYWKEVLKLPENQLPFKREEIKEWHWSSHPSDIKRYGLMFKIYFL